MKIDARQLRSITGNSRHLVGLLIAGESVSLKFNVSLKMICKGSSPVYIITGLQQNIDLVLRAARNHESVVLEELPRGPEEIICGSSAFEMIPGRTQTDRQAETIEQQASRLADDILASEEALFSKFATA